MAVAAMLVAAARVTATVRVLKSAACATVAVVTPLPTVTVHSVSAARVADAAVSVSVVVAPDPDVAAVNVVDPHPLDTLKPDGDAMVNAGSFSAMLSLLVCTSATFSTNVYANDDGDHVVGSAITSLLVDSAGATVAVDFVIFTAAMFATLPSFRVTAAVRPLQSDGWALVLVVTPVAIVNEHS